MNIVTLGDFSQTLQLLTFQIYCKAMQKTLASLFLATSLLVGGVTASVAAEPVRKSEDQQSFFERYTNAAQDVILQGLKLVGVRYRFGGNDEIKRSVSAFLLNRSSDRFGGNDEINGLDCSGFVRLVFKNSIGASLPRTAREMSEVGEQVDASQLKPGDLVFFNTMRRTFSHVGIYLGDNHFLHAPRTGAEVRVENMDNSYWMARYNGARRILEGN